VLLLPLDQEGRGIFRNREKYKIGKEDQEIRRGHIAPHKEDAVLGMVKSFERA
jgi:hypothetical protein